MKNVKILNDKKFFLDFAITKDKLYSYILSNRSIFKVKDISFYTKRIKDKSFSSYIDDPQHKAIAKEYLPFRVRITNKEFAKYGPNNPAPIGIAVIGLNNYIL